MFIFVQNWKDHTKNPVRGVQLMLIWPSLVYMLSSCKTYPREMGFTNIHIWNVMRWYGATHFVKKLVHFNYNTQQSMHFRQTCPLYCGNHWCFKTSTLAISKRKSNGSWKVGNSHCHLWHSSVIMYSNIYLSDHWYLLVPIQLTEGHPVCLVTWHQTKKDVIAFWTFRECNFKIFWSILD